MKFQYQRRSGFTVVEMTVASGLTVLLAVIVATTWQAFSRPTSSLIAWGQLFQEMNIAVETLARDLGGSLPDYQDTANLHAPLGGKGDGCLVMCQKDPNPPTHTSVDHLQLWFSSGTTTHAGWFLPDQDGTVVDYYVDTDSHTLVRSNYTPPGTYTPNNYTVASNIYGMSVGDDPNDSNNLTIQLTFQSPNYVPKDDDHPLMRTCTLVIRKQP